MEAAVDLFDDDIDIINNNALVNNGIVNVVNDIQPEEVYARRRPTRNENYFETTIPAYTVDEFKEHFRMQRQTMQMLLQAVGNHMRQKRNPIIALDKKLMLTIWLLAKPETFLACGDRFGISRGSAHYAFSEIVTILSNILEEYITWPNRHQCDINAQIFQEKSGGIPNVIGAIDGCHIFIKQPGGNAYDYYNRYQSHSIIIQAVRDVKRRFINISVGHPGRMHDARVFRRSVLHQCITNDNNPLIIPEQHIIGDCAYPLLQELITPFRNTGHLTAEQVTFNNRLSRIRSVIERAFALLKGKWRRLKYLDMSDMNLLNKVVSACCVVHNFILLNENVEDEDLYIKM